MPVRCSDLNRMDEVKTELWLALKESQPRDVVVLVLANKQDLLNALSPEEVSNRLGLTELNMWNWTIMVNA